MAIHDRQILRHGGSPGLRDRSGLEAAIMRPEHRYTYGAPDLAELAAAYAYGVAKAHAFIDGNKRTALVTTLVFLELNGHRFDPETADGVRMIEDLASGDITEAAFAIWLREGMVPLP